MKSQMRIISLVSVGLVLAILPSTTSADVLKAAPNKAVVFPADGSGVAKVALIYDLSGLRTGNGREIFQALLDWPLSGVPSKQRSEFFIYSVSSAWTVQDISAGKLPSLSEKALSTWDIEPMDVERNAGGFVRFNVLELVKEWLSGATPNFGVVITTKDLKGSTLANQLSEGKLTIRYGFNADKVQPE